MPGFKIKEQEGYYLSTAERETLEAITVLGDPGADRILFWDESANTWKFLTVGTGLNITDTTLTSTGLSNPMTAIGDLIYGDTAGAVARLAGNTTTTKKFLTSVGDGTNSTAPAYSLDFSTDGTFAGNSDTIIPSQKAIKTYVDGSVVGLLDYRGAYDASGNTYPTTGGSGTAGAVLKGDMWVISVAGTLGGEAVQVGDSIIANVDTPAQTASNWNHLNANISYVPEDVANKETTALDTSTTKYPCNNVVKEAVDAKQDSLGYTAENVANKKTSLTDNSNTYYPTQKAVKTAVDSKVNLDQTTPQTITDGSPLFSEGVDMANDKWLKSKDYAGTGYLNILKGNEDNEVDVGTQLNVGSIEAEEDSGAISLFDMPVSSASADGTEMSATIKIDGNNILKIYAESNGAGGADTFKVQLLNKAVLTMQDSAGTTHTYTADTDGSLIIS